MDGRTIAALVIGLVAGYILTRAMRPPVLVVPAPAPAQSSTPALTAAGRTVTPSIDSLAS
jgi:hypothetical protein